MAFFKWVGQQNWVDPTVTDKVIEFRANLRGEGKSSHFPIDPEQFVPGEFLRAPDVKDPGVTTPYDFTDEDYRLRQLRIDPRIVEVIPLHLVTTPPPFRLRKQRKHHGSVQSTDSQGGSPYSDRGGIRQPTRRVRHLHGLWKPQPLGV